MNPAGAASPIKMRRFSVGMPASGRPNLGQLSHVVDVAEAADRDERGGLALAQQVVDLPRAQRRVGGDQNRADLRERELQDDPFRHVRRPHDDALAALDAQRHQTARDGARFALECLEREPRPSDVHERLPVRQREREPAQEIADRHVAIGRMVHRRGIVYCSAVTEPCTVLIAASELLATLKAHSGVGTGELLTFADTDALQALDAITRRRPGIVALERMFAATPRGAALINRIKADPALALAEIRVLSHDSDQMRILPRTPATLTAPAPTAAATLPAPPLDQRGTRRAQRFRIAGNVDVLIDGNAATLVDLSTCGTQVTSKTVLKPNQRVRMALTDEEGAVRFSAAVAWASFEIPPAHGPRYRAGLNFVDANAAAVDAFCNRHKA